MANITCPPPFLQDSLYGNGGFVEGRLCQALGDITCCLPCPLTDWAYPDSFQTMTDGANWVAVASTICCVFLLLSWAVLPVEKTYRHYLSICLTAGVMCMNVGCPASRSARSRTMLIFCPAWFRPSARRQPGAML
jgi:hypothetical protein